MKSAIRNVLMVASGALVSVPLSVMGIAAADSGDHNPPVQHVIHSWDGVMPNFNLQVVGSEKQGQGTVVRNFVNNSNTTTVQQLSSNTNTNGNNALAEGGSATGGGAQAQLRGDQELSTGPTIVVVPEPEIAAAPIVAQSEGDPAATPGAQSVDDGTEPTPADGTTPPPPAAEAPPAAVGETSGQSAEG